MSRAAVGLAAVLSIAPLHADARELTVSVASSLGDVMTQIGRAFANAGGPVVAFNVAGSNTLARQIVNGAPVDAFVSADGAQMDIVDQAGRIVPGSRRDLLSNTLVLVVPAGQAPVIDGPTDLGGGAVRRVALGNPERVPAGVYARRWLERLGLWPTVAPRVVPTITVRAALATVRAGRADAGVVYATDAATEPGVTVVYRVPADEAPPIRYPVAVMRGDREKDAAAFVAFLAGPEARAIFEAAGFLTLD